MTPMPDYEVVMPNPLPFARWNCYRCPAGSGTVYRAPGSAGDGTRDEAYAHMRRTGHEAYYERGTREELRILNTDVPGTPGGAPWGTLRDYADPPDAEAWCAQTAALGAHRIRYEAGEWMRCDMGTTPLASVCRSGDDEPTRHRPEPRCAVCRRLAGVPTAPCPACPDARVSPTGWAAEASRLGLQQQLLPPAPDGKWKVQLHTGTEQPFETYPGGWPTPAGAAAAEADAAEDRHNRTHTEAGPVPGCPWCQAGGSHV
jgi:hypothetical protein